MAFEVVHADHRSVQREAQGARHARAHEQRTGQPRPSGVGHRVHGRQRQGGLGQHGVGQRQHATDVVSAGKLGHHAAIGLVHLDLAVQRVTEQARCGVAAGIDQRHAGFVTRRFDSQDKHGAKCTGGMFVAQ